MTFIAQRMAPMHYAELALYLAPRVTSWLTSQCLLQADAQSIELSGLSVLGTGGVPARYGWWYKDSEREEVTTEELREAFLLLSRVLCAWSPFNAHLQRAASAVASWRCLLPPLSPLGARVGPQGLLAVLALAVDPVDDALDKGLTAAALASPPLGPADQLLVYPAFERLIKTQPERLQKRCVRTLAFNCPVLLGLPTEAWEVLTKKQVAPTTNLAHVTSLASLPALFFHVMAELCHPETDEDERGRFESLLRVLGECEEPHSAPLRSTVSEIAKRCRRFGVAVDENVWAT